MRCPAKTSPDEAGSFSADRCHSLRSLLPPPVALPSLPIREVPGRSLVLSCEKESTILLCSQKLTQADYRKCKKVLGREPSYYIRSMNAEKSLTTEVVRLVFALPIFPGSRPPSIVGANELNFCVRNGNRWTLIAINTNYSIQDLVTHTGFEPMLTA